MTAHVVLFEPKRDATEEQRRHFIQVLKRAAEEIPGIRQARVGTTLSLGIMPKENIGLRTYQYAAFFEFDDRDALSNYLRHPKHDDLRACFWDLCLATLIVDVEMTDVASFEL